MVRWLAGLIVALAFAAQPALAQSGDTQEARLGVARQIVATRSEAAEMQFFRAKLPYYTNAIQAASHLDDAEQAALPALLEQEYRATLVISHEHSAATYARLFTLAQLQEVLAFYSSEAGRAMLANQQALTQDSIELQRVFDASVLSATAQRIQDQRAVQP